MSLSLYATNQDGTEEINTNLDHYMLKIKQGQVDS